MKIDRHNYEEFFILYMDNELNSEDKRQVEAFIALHPDLKEELDILVQYKLEPDTNVRFEGKEELLKINGDTPVLLANYEEWLSLYVDHELTAVQQKQVEDFIIKNPAAAKELLLLQRIKLQPETIIFPDKASLYRREEKRRAAPVRWWRMAAAAILVLGLGFGTYSLLNKKSATDPAEVAKHIAPKSDKDDNVQPDTDANMKESTVPVVEQLAVERSTPDKIKVNGNTDATQPLRNPESTNINLIKDEMIAQVPVSQNEEAQITYSNNLEKPSHNPNFNTQITKIAVPTALKNQVDPNPSLTNQHVTTQSTDPLDGIVTAANRDDGKKNTLRGFFRKVTRTFEKRTNIEAANDDDHLLVAGLAIKLR